MCSGLTGLASLIGFGFFKSIARFTLRRFTPVENVLVQTVAGAVGTMPLGVGCVGVLPALKYLLEPSENGPIDLSLGRLIVWSLGICFFGVFVAVPLRKEMIIREKLRFPSGTATALMIGVLHGDKQPVKRSSREGTKLTRGVASSPRRSWDQNLHTPDDSDLAHNPETDWKKKIKLLGYAFAVSAVYVSHSTTHMHNLNKSRPLFLTLFLKYVVFQYSGQPLLPTGPGPLTLQQPMLRREL